MIQQNSIEKIAIKWGVTTFLLLSAYFLIMNVMGLVHVVELRVFNAFIMFFGCYKAISVAKQKLEQNNYFQGIATGALTALFTALLFAFFGLIYINYLDPNFIQEITKNELFGFYMGGYGAIIQIFIEGAASGFMMSYAIMQWEKAPHSAAH